jgi:hypothetical protein
VGCNCPPGNYCRDGSTDCFDCAELSRLSFRSPERLATLSEGQGSRFPRVGGSGTDLLYQFAGVGLRYTTDSSTSAGSSVAQTMPLDGGPLLLPTDITSVPEGTEPFNFAFDRAVEGERRELHFGQWNNGLRTSAPAPAPYNEPGTSNFGLAIALQGGAGGLARAYWMTDRLPDMPLSLVTTLFAPEPLGVAVMLRVAPHCVAEPSDLTPWITADGKTLLFSHERLDDACASGGQGKDLYTALMVPATGQVLESVTGPTPAQPLADVNSSKDDTDPSFSADFCDLYFASNRDGEYALYRAHRR